MGFNSGFKGLISLPCQWPAKNSNCSSHWCVLCSGTWM